MRVLRSAIVALVTGVLPACGDDPPHYIDAGNGTGHEIDASGSVHDAPPVDAPPAPPDAPTTDAPMADAPMQDATAQDAQPQDAQPQDAQMQDAQPPVDAIVPLDSLSADAL